MHDVVLSKMLFMILEGNFVTVNVDEVTVVDAEQWINIHGYVMHNQKHVPILLTVEKVEMGATSNNIKGVILNAMSIYGGLRNSNMASKWIYLGCDDDSIVQDI